ncbi:MAG: protein kinase, partial [Acidobacteria bacterium]|nr:protein kinase [Acidobacteriota bacterium]
MIGKTLSHYRVVEKIGAGGMGEVYRAHDQRLERDVALKVLPTGTLADEAARKRFRKEALALAKLNHPHIATVFEFGTQDGVDFLVMELVEGVTLSDKLAGGPLLEKEIARLGMQLAEALEEAHERGVVHRDLKPGNVMVTAKGQAKVLDFGLAKLVRPDVASATATTESFTETQGVAGTLPYMAPEQLRGEPVDARTDIHALGAVLYEMATGQRAFPDRQAAQLTAAILQLPVSSPRALNRRVSVEMERIVLKCLEKEPENRYQSAKELAVDLRRLGRGTSTTAPAPWQVPRGSARWGWRRVGLVAVALLALVAVLVGLNVAGLRDRLLGGAAPGQITSIAVLPLENMMGDAEQDYFVEGMHEALITELSKIGALTVISRTSAMRYRNTDKSVPEIARELGVDAVIEGSVLRAGNQVRITAQLIEAATDRHLWADNFDRELRDILALHSDVARAIARQIRVTLTPKEESRLAAARPVNPKAFEAYLKGRFHWQKQTREDFDIAERYFQSALQKDPNYALAYAGLGMVWIMRGDAGFQAPSETFPKGTAFFAKAIELDDSSAEVRVSLANHKTTTQWDWSGAEKEFKRAIEINPNLADAHFFYADLLLALKRTEEWKREIKRARELD